MANWRFGAFPKLPYSTMQQLNLDWILDRIRRFLPDNGTKGQVLTRTKDGAAWQDVSAVAGSVNSVNGKTGDVVLTASDVGALPSTYQAPVTSVNGMIGDVVISGGGAVDSVNGQTGEVVLTAADVGALPESYVPPAAPVQSVNGQTGAVQLAIPDSTSDLTNDSGFITAAQAAAAAPVQSVNGKTGAVVLTASDVGAAEANTSGAGYCKMPDGTLLEWGDVTIHVAANTRGISDVTFQNPFIAAPYVFTAFGTVIITTGGAKPYESSAANVTSNGFRMYIGNLGDTSDLNAFWFAVGRWKN